MPHLHLTSARSDATKTNYRLRFEEQEQIDAGQFSLRRWD
ncbi:hypothetical protein N878_06735 [Pseudomonas sp. EGD-AK9]|nr:hypothetical protein N878_06735 [Pseudomonas sp. EGD-AK9]